MTDQAGAEYYQLSDSFHEHTLRRTFSILTACSRNSIYAVHSLSKDMLKRRRSTIGRNDLDITSLEVKYVDAAPGNISSLMNDTTESLSKVSIITSTKLCNTSNQSINLARKGSFTPTAKAPLPPTFKSKVLDDIEEHLRKVSQEKDRARSVKEKSSVTRSASAVVKGLRRLSSSASFRKSDFQKDKTKNEVKKVHSYSVLDKFVTESHNNTSLHKELYTPSISPPVRKSDYEIRREPNVANSSPLQFLVPNAENFTSASPHLDTNFLIGKMLATNGKDDITGALIYLLNNDPKEQV